MPRRNNQIKYIPPVKPACDHKKQYNTEEEAIRTARHQMIINHSLHLAVYRCDLCQKWHLTRNNKSIYENS